MADFIQFVGRRTSRYDRVRCFECERADKNAEPSQHSLLRFRQQSVAPVQQRMKRPMSRQRRTTSLPVHSESLVQEIRRALQTVNADAARNELDRERDPIKPAAEIRHDRRIRVSQLEALVAGDRALDEQLDRGKCESRLRIHLSVGWCVRERPQPMCVLALDAKRFATGRENVDVGCLAEHQFGKRRGRIDDVLAIVEDQQQTFGLQRRHQGCKGVGALMGEAQGRRNRRGEQPWIRDGADVDEAHVAGKLFEHRVRDGYGDGRLAHSARTDDRHETIGAQVGNDRADGLVAADHA